MVAAAIFQLSDKDVLFWLFAMVIFVVFEIATMGLYTIWFAGGSLMAFFAALMGFNVWVQLAVFLIVSAVLIFFTRPLAAKKLENGRVKTNVESLIGEKAKIIEPVDNTAGTGRALVNGQEWMTRSSKDDVAFPVNEVVEIVGISGVKIIVRKVEE
jgi:membrane protein implicated in regulation of membrane protease activity